MCGIAGIIHIDKEKVQPSVIKKMTDSIAHRGPDGDELWIDDNNRVGLGHRRLSIIDLSHEADQPMHYLERYTIVFNGEIYNYIELKEDLLKQGYHFKTTSDTEVLMALYDRHKENCLGMLDGMFAFAMYDAQEKKLFCARDRFGEKPFFYHYEKGKQFVFASEMKALWAMGIGKEVNNRMLYNYLAEGYLDNPADASETFYTACKRLPHASSLMLHADNIEITISPYYNIDTSFVNHAITEQQAVERFRELMYTSVKRRLRSDVPVGSSLSGGLDSSLVVCIIDDLVKNTAQVQKTFSAVFPGFVKDESRYIQQVVNATRVQPHYVTPDGQALQSEIDKLLYHQEEPIGSASIYVQYCVMRLAKENNVTVLLDGQGADEILAGYHFFYKRFFAELSATNKTLFAKELHAYNANAASNSINANVYSGLKSKVATQFQQVVPVAKKVMDRYNEMKSPFFNSDFYRTYKNDSFSNAPREKTLNQSLYNATMKKGLQELLRYADRNSMAHSREVRVPFLSHELVDFLFTLPPTFKIHKGWTKWILRQSFDHLLPQEICWRKDKIGYEPPQKSWLDNTIVKEKIAAMQCGLIQNKILHPSLAGKAIEVHEANNAKNSSWKMWMAGNLFNT
jgi:asparagine synthase (glutamine-hydrolysing)